MKNLTYIKLDKNNYYKIKSKEARRQFLEVCIMIISNANKIKGNKNE